MEEQGFCHHDHMVPRKDLRHTVGDDAGLSADDGSDQQTLAQGQILQRDIDDAAVCLGSELHCFDLAAEELVETFHHAALGVHKTADILADLVGGDVLGADGAVDAGFADEFAVIVAGGFGDDLFHACALGAHGKEQVFFVPACQCHHGICFKNALALLHHIVRAVTVEDQSVRQYACQHFTGGAIALHNGDLHAYLFESQSEVKRHAAAADDGHGTHAGGGTVHKLENTVEFLLRADEISAVTDFGYKVTVGDDGFVAAAHGAHQHAIGILFVIVHQAHACNAVGFGNGKADHFHAAACEGFHAERGGNAENAGDLLCCRLLGVDCHVEVDLVLELLRVAEIVDVADAGDGMPCTQLLCHETADDVHFVETCDGNDEIGCVCACFLQYAQRCAVAVYAHDIHHVFCVLQGRGFSVHHGQIMPFAGKLTRESVADFACANNHDFHIPPLLPAPKHKENTNYYSSLSIAQSHQKTSVRDFCMFQKNFVYV